MRKLQKITLKKNVRLRLLEIRHSSSEIRIRLQAAAFLRMADGFSDLEIQREFSRGIAAIFRPSRETIGRWRRQFTREGLQRDNVLSDRRGRYKRPNGLEIRLLQKLPSLSAESLTGPALSKIFHVHPDRIRRILRRHGMNLRGLRIEALRRARSDE